MKNILYVLILGLIISAICLIPFAVIWALNTLFSLGIAYTFWTWLAVVVLNLTWMNKQIPKVNPTTKV